MENFKTYHKIKRLGDEENKEIFTNPEDEIIIQEKIDGGNFRFAILNGKLIFGSRTQQLTNDEGEDTNLNKNFKRCVEFVREKLTNCPHAFDLNLIFFGECCVKHTISYDWDKIPPFLGFDIYDIKEERYLDYRECYELYTSFGLPMVPLVGIKKAGEIKDVTDKMVPISMYSLESAKDRKAEGVVYKNYTKQIFAKYVRDAFKERNAEAFGGSPKYNKTGEDNNADFVFKYCTNARIEKNIFKLIDGGEELHMKLMAKLPKVVYEDIIQEEWREILTNKKWTINFQTLNKLITKRCLNVLVQIITNNALNNSEE